MTAILYQNYSHFLVPQGISNPNIRKFSIGNIPKVKEQTNKMILRAEMQGRPIKNGKQITVGEKIYVIIYLI